MSIFYRNYNNYYNMRNYNNNKNTNYITDYGPMPFAYNIKELVQKNTAYRATMWTGENLQVALMNIASGENTGLKQYQNLDQFIQINQGKGIIKMGDNQNNLDFQRNVGENFAFIIPAGKWYELINTGNETLKLYSIYTKPKYQKGTVHLIKRDAEN